MLALHDINFLSTQIDIIFVFCFFGLQYALAYGDVPSNQVWLKTDQKFRRHKRNSPSFDYINPRCNLDLEDSKQNVLHDTPAHDTPQYKVWLQKVERFRRYRDRRTDGQTDRPSLEDHCSGRCGWRRRVSVRRSSGTPAESSTGLSWRSADLQPTARSSLDLHKVNLISSQGHLDLFTRSSLFTSVHFLVWFSD